MKRIGDYTEEGAESWLKRQTVVGLGIKVLGVVVALSLVIGTIGFFGGWFRTAVQVVSPANVKAQWQFAYDYDASLEAIAQQWCTAKQVENTEPNPDYQTQRVTQRVAVENNYNAVAARYNGRLNDAFRAKLVKPSDVPDQAPVLTTRTRRLCPLISE